MVDDAVRALAEGLGKKVALVALGGYGRQMLCPASDIDLMVLHAERRPDRVREAAERVFYPFWDAGLELGHGVRTVGECMLVARTRLDVATSLIDARLVWGEQGLFRELVDGLGRKVFRDPRGLLGRLHEASAERRVRYGSCSSLLEPELKEGAGGLRDVHTVGWAARAVFGSAGLQGLVGEELLRQREAASLDDAEEFLVRLRSSLHLETGKATDRLVLDFQPGVAAAFGYEGAAGLGAADALMRALFEHARQVEHVLEVFFERAGARVAAKPPGHLEVPAAPTAEQAMRAFARAAVTGAQLSPAALDAVEGANLRVDAWSPGMLEAFVEILGAGAGGTVALEAMDRAGLLSRFLPQWEPVRCRPQRDPYHRSTVDVHLLHAAANAARLMAGAGGDDEVGTVAASAVSDRAAVLLGAFLHDIGKIGEGSHVEVGVRVAAAALERMGVTGPTGEAALFLVREHLLLSDTATRRDLSDENMVLDVAARVGDPERLAMLYLLTAADAEATGPHAWTPWRQALVRELVGKVQHVLERGEMGPGQAHQLEERIQAIRERLAAEDRADVDGFIDRMPRGYLMAANPQAAPAHFALVTPPITAAEVRTHAVPGPRPGTYELVVVAADRPGLLARIAGALALGGLNILSAQAFTTEDGVALDLFTVQGAFEPQVDEDRWRGVRTDLRKALEGRISLEYRVSEKRKHYPAPGADIPTSVTVDNDASDFATVVEVSAADRIGLLFDLARAFHELELDVHVAKVATYGARVVDVFYVRDLFGRKVEDPEQAREIERAVLLRLTGP